MNTDIEAPISQTLGSLDREIEKHKLAANALTKQAESLLARARNHEKVASELADARSKLTHIDLSPLKASNELLAPRQRERKNSFAWRVRQHAFGLIKAAGRPLGRAELLDGLIHQGLKIESPNPLEAIGKIMWHAKEFENKSNGYWIVGLPLPQGSEHRKRYKRPRAVHNADVNKEMFRK